MVPFPEQAARPNPTSPGLPLGPRNQMSNANTQTKLTAEEEETLYFRDSKPVSITVNLEHLKVDRMCSLCGHWKSEHPWETCSSPNWL